MSKKRNDNIVSMPTRLPEGSLNIEVEDILYELDNGERNIDWSRLTDTLTYIDGRYDCADFRYQSLIRILYKYNDLLPEETHAKIKTTVLNFKYWMDEPGADSMCFWSENHQILFAASEYLIGQLYPDEIFLNDGKTGTQHMEKAQIRILDWLQMRWDYGFIEYYSNVYYNEDIAPMINLIDFCDDEEISKKTIIIMDLLIYDIASQNYDGAFVSVSGRAYENNRKGGALASGKRLTDYLFDINTGDYGMGLSYCFTSSDGYIVPSVLTEIGLDKSQVVIKASNGLKISELKDEGFIGYDNRSMMMQWGMESFTNAPIVRNTLAYIRKNDMFTNDSLKPLAVMDIALVRLLHLEPLISKIINPQSNGIAIQRGNTYTYKNENYSMYTVQDYFPGDFGDQQHIQGVNVNNQTSVFHVHPAVKEGDSGANGNSPKYWVSYGHLPHAVQDMNIQLAIYNVPNKKSMMEKSLLDFTHMYFDKSQYDEVVLDDNYLFGRIGNTYIAIITYNEMKFKEGSDDILQGGKQSFYITQMATTDDFPTLSDYMEYIKNNKVIFDNKKLKLTYENDSIKYELTFGKDFIIDNQKINLNYSRYDAPYIVAEQKDETLTFSLNNKSLFLDFNNMIRKVVN